jgi:hypothetical protein
MKRHLIEYLVETVKSKGNNVAVIENEIEISFHQIYQNICLIGNYILEKSDIINKPIVESGDVLAYIENKKNNTYKIIKN